MNLQGYGDAATWPEASGHPNDPRTQAMGEYDEDGFMEWLEGLPMDWYQQALFATAAEGVERVPQGIVDRLMRELPDDGLAAHVFRERNTFRPLADWISALRRGDTPEAHRLLEEALRAWRRTGVIAGTRREYRYCMELVLDSDDPGTGYSMLAVALENCVKERLVADAKGQMKAWRDQYEGGRERRQGA